MTTLNIPSSPSQGATYEANGVVYTWDGTKWKADSSNVSNLNGGQLAGFRNKLINGNFEINQRGSVFTLADNPSPQQKYTLDRWGASYAGIIATVSQDIQTPGATDSRYGIRVAISNGGGGTNNYLTLFQKVEDCSTLAGKPFTLSFTAKANTAVSMGVEFTRSYGAGGSSSDTAVVTEKVDLTTSFTKYTITGTMPSVSGKTFGSDAGDLGVFFWMTAGTDYDSRASSIGLQTGTIDIMDVQLEPGPVATPFEQRPIGTELALCQRYYQNLPEQYKSLRDAAGTSYFCDGQIALFAPMRSTPTCTFNRVEGELVNLPVVDATYTNRFSLVVKYSGTGNSGQTLGFTGTADAEL